MTLELHIIIVQYITDYYYILRTQILNYNLFLCYIHSTTSINYSKEINFLLKVLEAARISMTSEVHRFRRKLKAAKPGKMNKKIIKVKQDGLN